MPSKWHLDTVADLKAAVDAFSAARTAKADPPCEWLRLGRGLRWWMISRSAILVFVFFFCWICFFPTFSCTGLMELTGGVPKTF